MAAKRKPARASRSEELYVELLERNRIDFTLIGTSPIILNRLSEKAKRELLFPSGRKTTGDKMSRLKHDPIDEYRASIYTDGNPAAPTHLMFPVTAFKDAMRSVAVDLPGSSSKAQIGRLLYVEQEYAPLWGKPTLRMDAVRQADMRRTPDIRTRACIREWVTVITVTFTTPILSHQAVANLVANAGAIQGVGDWRPEKGSGSYGRWTIANGGIDDPEVQRIVEQGGRSAQMLAMETPTMYDHETAELYEWFEEEATARGFRKGKAS
jgi:hypothetical protein